MACRVLLLVATLGAALPLLAAEVATDWIEPRAGSADAALGAEVRSVEREGEELRIGVAVPKTQVGEPAQVEEIVVVGRRGEGEEESLPVRYRWVADYDRDHYGLVLYLGRRAELPLRIYFKVPDRPQ
ncbi:MAG: hypothetical protein KatS3mg124_2196 [Porticoccaceae bacterium]|nr:MAG: hypothetical protein KatS3mg124_2196 [Porticoccaceae bacterium]